MAKLRSKSSKPEQPTRFYRGARIPQSVIRRFARQIAERFQPEKIILFGSRAYGTPNEDSDVDILVVMPARNQLDQAFKIRWTLLPPFPLDLIVRTPRNLQMWLDDGESFHTEIVSRGRVLYENRDARLDPKSRSRPSRRAQTRGRPREFS